MSDYTPLPPLDDQQLVTRNKLLGSRWHEGYYEGRDDYGDPEKVDRLNDVNQLRGLYSLYDAGSRVGHPGLLPLLAPRAITGIISQLVQDLVRNQLAGGKK